VPMGGEKVATVNWLVKETGPTVIRANSPGSRVPLGLEMGAPVEVASLHDRGNAMWELLVKDWARARAERPASAATAGMARDPMLGVSVWPARRPIVRSQASGSGRR